MDSHDTPTQDKQITIAVPENRVPEFYAFYGRFLAGRSGRPGRRGPRGHGHGCCGHRSEERSGEAQPATEAREA